MKKLLTAAALSLVALASLPVHAQQTAQSTFTVRVNLTGACLISLPATELALAYTSFGAAASNTLPFSVQCTNALPYSIGISTAAAGPYLSTYGLTLSGLPVTLNAPTGSFTGQATSATAGGRNHAITASIAAGLPGTCVGGATNNVCTEVSATQYLTISY